MTWGRRLKHDMAMCPMVGRVVVVLLRLKICFGFRESAETIVLLEAILDGLSDEKSGAKRELCAKAAKEFLIWSAKHIPMAKGRDGASSSRASSNLNAASLLRRIFERLAHPQAYQRYAPLDRENHIKLAQAQCAEAGALADHSMQIMHHLTEARQGRTITSQLWLTHLSAIPHRPFSTA